MTIAVGGMDIDIRLLVNLRMFIKEEYMAGFVLFGVWWALTHKHFQMFVEREF